MTCIQAFETLKLGQARVEQKVDQIHEQTAKTNGHVADLFEKANANRERIGLNASEIAAIKASGSKLGERTWQVISALLIAGILAVAGYFFHTLIAYQAALSAAQKP